MADHHQYTAAVCLQPAPAAAASAVPLRRIAIPIDLLGSVGHNANDTGDADTGANNLKIFPAPLTYVQRVDADTVALSGTLNSSASTAFRIDFDASERIDDGSINLNAEFGDADRLGTSSLVVTTDGSGNASFGPQVIEFLGSGFIAGVAATATRLDGGGVAIETSEIGLLRCLRLRRVELRRHQHERRRSWLVQAGLPGGACARRRRHCARSHQLLDSGRRPACDWRRRADRPRHQRRLEVPTAPPSRAGSQTRRALAATAQLPIDIRGMKFAFHVLGYHDPVGRRAERSERVADARQWGGRGQFIGVSQDGQALGGTQRQHRAVNCIGACRIGGSTLAQRNLIAADTSGVMKLPLICKAMARWSRET